MCVRKIFFALISKLYLSLSFVCFVWPADWALAQGYTESFSSLTRAVEESLSFDDEALQAIYNYRSEIRKNSYSITMRLCPVYRLAIGKGLPDYHKKMRKPEYVNHPHAEVRSWASNMSDKYGDDVSRSLQEWVRVVYEGGAQPFSAIFGMKSDYLYFTHHSLLAFRSWFYSLYTLYLVDSLGFVSGAMHCLGTMKNSEINRFAQALLIVDSEMSLAGHAVTFWTGGKIIGLIVKGAGMSFRPVAKASQAFLKKMGWEASLVKKYAMLGGGLGLSAFGAWAAHSILSMRESSENIRQAIKDSMGDSISQENSFYKGSEQLRNYALLQRAFQIHERLSEESGPLFFHENSDNLFGQFVLSHFNESDFLIMREHYESLKGKSLEDSFSEKYFNLLDQFFPIVEDFWLNNF